MTTTPRDIEARWVELDGAAGFDRDAGDPRDLGDRDRERFDRDRDIDPRDVFLDGIELPRGLEREVVMDGDDRYELNGDDSRTVAAVGAFRVIADRDLQDRRDESGDARDPDLRHLRNQGLTESVKLTGRDRAVTLTERGHRLLERHRREDRSERDQAFDACSCARFAARSAWSTKARDTGSSGKSPSGSRRIWSRSSDLTTSSQAETFGRRLGKIKGP